MERLARWLANPLFSCENGWDEEEPESGGGRLADAAGSRTIVVPSFTVGVGGWVRNEANLPNFGLVLTTDSIIWTRSPRSDNISPGSPEVWAMLRWWTCTIHPTSVCTPSHRFFSERHPKTHPRQKSAHMKQWSRHADSTSGCLPAWPDGVCSVPTCVQGELHHPVHDRWCPSGACPEPKKRSRRTRFGSFLILYR